MDWENELRQLGVFDRALQVFREQGSEEAVRQVRSAFLAHCKTQHPDLNQENRPIAEENMRRLNAFKERLDRGGPGGLGQFLAAKLASWQSGAKLLVVEDEDRVRDEVSLCLQRQGYRVMGAANGIQGMSAHFSFKPDLVITDVVMPLMDGISMVNHLRDKVNGLKVIFMSAFCGPGQDASQFSAQIARMGYPLLNKPFELNHLLSLVESGLGRGGDEIVF